MKSARISRVSILVAIGIISLSLSSCMRYLTHNREEVLLEGVDIDQTLMVAEVKMRQQQGKLGEALPIWVIRDQKITASQGQEISRLYFLHINSIRKKFDIWHLTWAISDLYRLGDDSAKIALQDAYRDATRRAKDLGGIADRMVNGDKLYMGDAHGGGRAFAKKHVVVPGRKGYLQSYEEYIGLLGSDLRN
jgi:hypothetical protein